MKIHTPESMAAELAAWNNGAGIDLLSWVGCTGSFSLAVGYAAVFWPQFAEYDGYFARASQSIPYAGLRSRLPEIAARLRPS